MANTECIQEARHVNMLNSQAESPQHYDPISCVLACTKINLLINNTTSIHDFQVFLQGRR